MYAASLRYKGVLCRAPAMFQMAAMDDIGHKALCPMSRGLRQGWSQGDTDSHTSTMGHPGTVRSLSPVKSAQNLTHLARFCMRALEISPLGSPRSGCLRLRTSAGRLCSTLLPPCPHPRPHPPRPPAFLPHASRPPSAMAPPLVSAAAR